MSLLKKNIEYAKKYHLVLIILIGLAVRLIGWRFMDYTNFPEFYRDYIMTEKIAFGGQLVLLGPPSMLHHFHFGPIYYYIFTPLFALFGGHPFSLILTGAIVSVITIFYFYKLLLLWSGDSKLAAAGGWLLALSLYAVHLTSYVSNPNFLPLFTLIALILLTRIIQDGAKLKNYFILGAILAIAGQLHATALLVLPLTFLLSLLLAKKLPNAKQWLALLAAGTITYLPYLFFELTHGFQNTLRLLSLGQNRLTGTHFFDQITAVFGFFSGSLTPFNYYYSYTYLTPNSLYIAVIFLAAACLISAIYQIIKYGVGGSTTTNISPEGKKVLYSWSFACFFSLLIYNGPLQAHYLIILWPLPLMLLVFGIFWVNSKIKILKPLLLLLTVTSVLQIYSFYRTEHTGWEQFYKTLHSDYQNRSGIEEIGS
ncbi:MAG: glycosyltransferase family 39 protein [Candidatus Doudnabacteria bacterium]|nr:glycosyltransferase family 39 protein [Candidatus Doudnabacteria bacterium]